jgi:hypothetical protein
MPALALDVVEDSPCRLLQTLVGMEVFFEYSDGTFTLNQMTEALLSDMPDSLRHLQPR